MVKFSGNLRMCKCGGTDWQKMNFDAAYENTKLLGAIDQFLTDVLGHTFWTDEVQDKWDNEYHPRNWKKGQVVCEGEEE